MPPSEISADIIRQSFDADLLSVRLYSPALDLRLVAHAVLTAHVSRFPGQSNMVVPARNVQCTPSIRMLPTLPVTLLGRSDHLSVNPTQAYKHTVNTTAPLYIQLYSITVVRDEYA